MRLLNLHFLLQHTRMVLLFGFAPAVVLIGMMTEPRPSWIDLINIVD
jgi:hypothetical protein